MEALSVCTLISFLGLFLYIKETKQYECNIDAIEFVAKTMFRKKKTPGALFFYYSKTLEPGNAQYVFMVYEYGYGQCTKQ